MKKHFIIFRSLLLLAFVFTLQNVSFSQPPPPPTSNHGSAGNAPPGGGGGAPVGDGLIFLVAMAGLYGGKKIYDARKPVEETEA
jgi:hypothetical protein